MPKPLTSRNDDPKMTELRRLEQDGADREALLRGLLDGALDCVICTDGEARITEWNASAEAVFGWPASVVVGRRVSDVVAPPGLAGPLERALTELVSGTTLPAPPQRLEFTATDHAGKAFQVEASVAVIATRGRLSFALFVRPVLECRVTFDELAVVAARR